MTERMSVAEFRRQYGNSKAPITYGATAVREDGWRFASKLERDRFLYWKNLWLLGQIAWFTRQVPFYLPGGIIYRADFLVVEPSGLHHSTGRDPVSSFTVIVEDCKGHMTDTALNKHRQVEAIYGIKVQIIKRGERGAFITGGRERRRSGVSRRVPAARDRNRHAGARGP